MSKKTGLNFGEAIEALREGKLLYREDWGELASFVFMQIPAVIDVDIIVPKMQSLPQSVKDEFLKRRKQELKKPTDVQFDKIYYYDQLAMVNSVNDITGYSPSPSDALAENWIILD